MSSLWNSFDSKKILVTGHTGFVGAWICLVLAHFGCDITGFSLPEEKGSLYEKIHGKLNIKSVYGNLCDKDCITEVVNNLKPDIVFHIAAFGFVKECMENPERAFATNVQGTLNLFEAIKTIGKPCKIIVASSDKVYQNSDLDTCLFTEEDSLGGLDPYSASKTCEDLLVRGYFDSYLMKQNCMLSVIRPSNILGGGDHNMNRLIPSIYFSFSNGSLPEIRNPDSVRPWQNIFDIVDVYITVAEAFDEGCHVYNVGPEPAGIKSVGEIVSYVSHLYSKDCVVPKTEQSSLKEMKYLGLSIDKIKIELNWKPKRNLEQTLKEIYYFYNNDNGKNTYDLCMEQIMNYYEED